jgi:hypothetical protein
MALQKKSFIWYSLHFGIIFKYIEVVAIFEDT